MLISLMSLILILCLNIYLDDNSSNKVDLNMNWNSSIMICNYSSIIINSLASDFFKFY